MATLAHCAYCFECLSSSLERRKALSLSEVEDLWSQYENAGLGDGEEDGSTKEQDIAQASHLSPKPAPINRLLGPSSSTNSSSSLRSSNNSTPSNSTDDSTPPSKSSSRTSISRLSENTGSYAAASRNRKSGDESHPLFVTWNTVGRSGQKNLRGCIGTFEAQPLTAGLRNYALTAAFEDTRFRPISSRELPSLDCGVTLLTDFEPASDPMDWVVGQHGIRLSFNWEGRRFGATYLPDVAREQGWTKEETLTSLMRKAGWNGNKSDWRSVKNMQVVRYQGKKVSLDWQSWKEWKDWVREMDQD